MVSHLPVKVAFQSVGASLTFQKGFSCEIFFIQVNYSIAHSRQGEPDGCHRPASIGVTGRLGVYHFPLPYVVKDVLLHGGANRHGLDEDDEMPPAFPLQQPGPWNGGRLERGILLGPERGVLGVDNQRRSADGRLCARCKANRLAV
jgi:hypothetical protein